MPEGLSIIQAQQVRQLIQQYAVRDKNQPNQNRKQPATVVAYDDDAVYDTTVDPDEPTSGNFLFARNITGHRLQPGARVMIEFIEPHGLFVVGVTEYDATARGVIAFFSNDNDQGPITTEVNVTNGLINAGVVGFDRVIRITGFASISASASPTGVIGNIQVDGSNVGRWCQDNFFDGTSVIHTGAVIIPNESNPDPITPGTHSFGLRIARVQASGNITLNGSAVDTYICVEDMGPVSQLP